MYMHAYIHTYIHNNIHNITLLTITLHYIIALHTYIPTYLHTYLHIYIQTYTYIYICMYIYIYICVYMCTMEAHYVEAGSMSIFWTQNRALKTTSLARVLIRTWWDPVGPRSSLRWDPNWARWDPVGVGPKSGSVGRGGTRWVPALLYVGPYTPFGFYNAN